MKKIRISLLALFALTAVGMSFTSFSEPGAPQTQGLYVSCNFHGVEMYALVPSNSPNPRDVCLDLPSYDAAEAQHIINTGGYMPDGVTPQHDPRVCLGVDPVD